MAQITIYVDDELEQKMRSSAKSMGLSLSKWIANTVKNNASDDWPESIRSIAGSWSDMPTAEEIRESFPADVKREII